MTLSSKTTIWTKPKTTTGKWSVYFIVIFVVLFVINVAVLQQFPGVVYDQNLWFKEWFLPVFVILMLLCGLAGGIIGIVAFFRYRERSWAVLPSIFFGLFVLLLVANEFTQFLRYLFR